MASPDYQSSLAKAQQPEPEVQQPEAGVPQPGVGVSQPEAGVPQPGSGVSQPGAEAVQQPSAEVQQPSERSATESPPRGKPPTRGGLQILKENIETTRTYTYFSIGTTLFRWLANILLAVAFDVTKLSDLSFLNVFQISDYVIPSLLILLCFIMKKISRPLYSDGTRRKLISPGYDLNMEYGLGEHLKDIILVLVVTYLLTLIHNLFFFTLGLLPIRLLYFLYVYVVEPYLAVTPEGTEPRQSNRSLHIICVIIVFGYFSVFFLPTIISIFSLNLIV